MATGKSFASNFGLLANALKAYRSGKDARYEEDQSAKDRKYEEASAFIVAGLSQLVSQVPASSCPSCTEQAAAMSMVADIAQARATYMDAKDRATQSFDTYSAIQQHASQIAA